MMAHAALKDTLKSASSLGERGQHNEATRPLSTLLSQFSSVVNMMLEGTGRSVVYDDEKNIIVVNGGTASGGGGPVESIHASSITELFNTRLLNAWGLNDVEQNALRTIASAVEQGEQTSSGNLHRFSVGEHTFEYSVASALQGALDILSARIRERQQLKKAVLPLRESIASLMSRLGIQREAVSNKGTKGTFPEVIKDDYAKIYDELQKRDVRVHNADLHLGIRLADLVESSHETVQFVERSKQRIDETTADDEPEIGEYGSVEDVENAASRYTQYIHGIISRLDGRGPLQMVGGFFLHDLEREEQSVERLFDVVEKQVGQTKLSADLAERYEAVQELVRLAKDRTSADRVRFAAARAGLISLRDLLAVHTNTERELKVTETRKREQLLFPIAQWSDKLETALSEYHPQGNQTRARHTVSEFTFLDNAVSVLADLRKIQRGVYTSIEQLKKTLDDDGILDAAAFSEQMRVYCEDVLRVIRTPEERGKKAEKAFEYLLEGVLETTTHHAVRFERIDDRFTFHIPTPIAAVVQDSRLRDQVHSGTYQSLAEAIRYANKMLIISESQIIGLEERASEANVDDALARIERQSRVRVIETPYRSLRSKVTRVVAAMLGVTFGMTAHIPEAPRKEPTYDVDSRRDAQPIPAAKQKKELPTGAGEHASVKAGATVTVPAFGTVPEHSVSFNLPPAPSFMQSVVPKELDAQIVQMKKAFTAPVTSEHGTYGLLKLVRAYIGDSRTLTPDERKATDWFTHAFTRFINELPEERIAQLVPNVRLPRGVIASTIPSKVGGVPVLIDFSAILKTEDFWKWFDTFYAKRKSTSLAQPGLKGIALSVDSLTRKLKLDFGVIK